MSKIIQVSILSIFVFLAGCSGIAKYDDSEQAAIVNGQEITVGDLRFLYPDDTALDYLDGAIEIELVKQKVEEMDIDISDNLSDESDGASFEKLPTKNTEDEGAKQIRKFAESQAKKLDMKPEEFQREYAQRIDEQNAYMVTYLEEMLSEADFDSEKGLADFNEEARKLLDELVEENEAGIEVLIE